VRIQSDAGHIEEQIPPSLLPMDRAGLTGARSQSRIEICNSRETVADPDDPEIGARSPLSASCTSARPTPDAIATPRHYQFKPAASFECCSCAWPLRFVSAPSIAA
jgi:hypothetical protein